MRSATVSSLRAICLPMALALGFPGVVQARGAEPAPTPPSYADLVDLADGTPLVLRAQIRKIAPVEPGRAGSPRPGWGRIYAETRTEALLAGSGLAGESTSYLADVKLDARGRLPKLDKRSVLLFARPVSGRPGELQLVAPDAQILWDQETEARLRGVLAELLAPHAPRRVTDVREAIFVPGNLVGEGETQLFLNTADGEPSSITVVHTPNQPARWSVSFSEVVDSSTKPPAKDTLAWYRLACFLPARLGAGVNVSDTPENKAQAEADYGFVLKSMGPCERTRG